MSRFETFGAYPDRGLPNAEAALLTLWPSLNRYHDDLALIGGLAVHYLIEDRAGSLPSSSSSSTSSFDETQLIRQDLVSVANALLGE